jgi:hypothetical protein
MPFEVVAQDRNVADNDARETVTVLPFHALSVTSAFNHSRHGVTLAARLSCDGGTNAGNRHDSRKNRN